LTTEALEKAIAAPAITWFKSPKAGNGKPNVRLDRAIALATSVGAPLGMTLSAP
jgi:hypothetical protein